jgi:hypothetical protein
VRAKNAVFFDQIGNRLLPPVGPPTGHSHHEESNRSDIHNRGSLHYRLHGAPESTSAENWDTTAPNKRTVHPDRTRTLCDETSEPA